MAKLDDNGLLYFWQRIKTIFVTTEEFIKSKINVIDNLISTSTTDALSANQGRELDRKIKAINDNIGNLGGGDMLKSVYDTNNNGKVDTAENADKLGGQTPDYYAPASSLNGYVPTSKVGQASGVASLGSDGKVPETQLPAMLPPKHPHTMDDVEGLNEAAAGLSAALEEAVGDMTEIAQGKCACYVFDTVAALDEALAEYVAYITNGTEMAETNVLSGQTLKTGDVFLIRATDVPDYWWDESSKSKQILETTKVDLSVISNAEIDAILAT